MTTHQRHWQNGDFIYGEKNSKATVMVGIYSYSKQIYGANSDI